MQTNNHSAADKTSLILFRNLLLAFIFFCVLTFLFMAVPGYTFAIYEMAIRNKNKIDEIENKKLNNNLPDLTMEDKRMFKIENYWYILAMKESTPMSSETVILLPPTGMMDSLEGWKNFGNSEYMEYYMYPRLVISENEKDSKPELYKKVTHVAVMNNWGLDRLPYTPEKIEKYAIYPIKPPAAKPIQAPQNLNTLNNNSATK